MTNKIIKLPEDFDLRTINRQDLPFSAGHSAKSRKRDRIISTASQNIKPAEDFDLRTINCYDLPLSAEHPVMAKSEILRERFKPLFNMHYALELGFVLSGRMKRYYQHWHTELDAGQVWLCGIWEPHCFEILKSPCHIIMYTILPEMLATTRFPESASFNGLAPFIVPPQKRPYVKTYRRGIFLSLGRRIIDVLGRSGNAERILLRLLLLETIIQLCRSWPIARLSSSRIRPGDSFSVVNRAVEMVFKSHELIPMHAASKACGLREPVFSRLFAKVMGINFTDFSFRYRLDGAKEQLIHSQDPLKMIASAWGFTDKSHFHHVFVQHYGCTPLEFRKRYLYLS